MSIKSKPLDKKWKALLDLGRRKVPELCESADEVRDTPHAGAIRTTLKELGASAVFCVQGVPTIAIISVDNYDRKAIVNLHAALWNQGLASLLLVLSGDTVRAFSLARTPYSDPGEEFDNRCLVQELNAIADALAIKDIIYGAESGRLWKEHASYFKPKERIDYVLLDNLTESHQELCDEVLSSDAAQTLLIQVMFIAYLEDREITTREYFLSASNDRAESFSALLKSGKVNYLNNLFNNLRGDFNGDLFIAPCSFDASDPRPRLNRSHLETLARFRSGREEMGGGQYRFWGYDFKYIPIELISAVYDRFLGEREAERRKQGAYYTPMFLADTVISQVWDTLSPAVKDKGRFLDPACGSGVFLVRSFQRLCEHWREKRKSRKIRWDGLLAILNRLHGWDLNGGAVRVAVFSLYIALLEEVHPPDIRLLIKRGKLLPELWGHQLRRQDFFTIRPDDEQFDVVIGNPPWISRRGQDRSSIKWCDSERFPMPGREDAWAFVWKSLQHLREDGVAALLLPAMGFLHNHAENAVAARNRLLQEARIWRVINFADLRFQLFEGAVRPAALIIFGNAAHEAPAYRFDYWAPKADLNLKIKRLITLSSADKSVITSHMAADDPRIFKRRLWMTGPEEKLFNYLSALPKLGDLVDGYGNLMRRRKTIKEGWIIGQGFKPARVDRLSDPAYKREYSEIVAETPYLPIEAFRTLVQTDDGLRPWRNGDVHRRGFEKGFKGPRVLIPRGVSTTQMRLRAAYVEKPLTFQNIIQAIVVPRGEERRGKLLTALLNSRVTLWFAFHGTASFGSDRPEVQQAELLRIPFPLPNDLPEPDRSQFASDSLISLIDKEIEVTSRPFRLRMSEADTFMNIDHWACEFFCLSNEEITLIDDAIERVIPAVQPRQGSFPDIWKPANKTDRQAYAATLVRSMDEWFDGDYTVGIKLVARNSDLAILRMTLEEMRKDAEYVEENDRSVGEVLSKVLTHIHQPLPGNFQLMPDFRIFIGQDLFLIKPIQKRFWLKSAALADADAIALDLQDAVGLCNNRSHT